MALARLLTHQDIQFVWTQIRALELDSLTNPRFWSLDLLRRQAVADEARDLNTLYTVMRHFGLSRIVGALDEGKLRGSSVKKDKIPVMPSPHYRYAIVRLCKQHHVFEVLCRREECHAYKRQKTAARLDDQKALAVTLANSTASAKCLIFSSVERVAHAHEDILGHAFGTTDPLQVARRILQEGRVVL